MEGDTLVRYLVLALEVGLTAGLIFWMRSSTRGKPIAWSLIFTILLAGGFVAIVSAFVTITYTFDIKTLELTRPDLVDQYKGLMVFYNVVGAATVEELAKYTVGVYFLVGSRKVRKLSDVIISMIVVGLGFSLIEDILYLMTTDAPPTYRLLSFYLHSGTSAIIGYALGRFHIGKTGYRELLRALLAAIGLHICYNLALHLEGTTLPLLLAFMVTIFISLQIFILFRKTLEEEYDIERHSKKKPRAVKLLNL